MHLITLAANIYGIVALVALAAMLGCWADHIIRKVKPAVQLAIGRAGLGHRPSRVEAALVRHHEVCSACGYPKAEGNVCPECGQRYAGDGVARRVEIDHNRAGALKRSRRRAVWASAAFWLLLIAGVFAMLAYELVNTRLWGGPRPEVMAYELTLGPYENVARAGGHPLPTTEYQLCIRAEGVVGDPSSRDGQPLQDARVEVWIEHGRHQGTGLLHYPAIIEYRSATDHWRKTQGDGRRAVASDAQGTGLKIAIAHLFEANGLDDGKPSREAEMADAVQGVEVVLGGTSMALSFGPLSTGANDGLGTRARGRDRVWDAPLRPFLPAALVGAGAGCVPLIFGLMLAWLARRRDRSAKDV